MALRPVTADSEPPSTIDEAMEAAAKAASARGCVALVMWQEPDGTVDFRAWPPVMTVVDGLLMQWHRMLEEGE